MTEQEHRDAGQAHGSTMSRLASALNERLTDGQTEAGPQKRVDEVEHLCLRVGDDLYAVAIGQVNEVVAPTAVTQVPHLAAHIPGVVSHHGGIAAVLDLAIFCGKEPEQKPKRLVILDWQDLRAAVPVSEILGIMTFASDQIEPPLPHEASKQQFIIGQVKHDGVVFSLIDAEALLKASRHKAAGAGK